MKVAISSLLLICTCLSPNGVLGQSLSIRKETGTNYWVEATAPANNPHTLQASDNLHLWVDIRNPVLEAFSLQIPITSVSNRYFRLIQTPPEASPIRVMVIGDSLAAEGTGWGGEFSRYLKPNATFVNYAIGGYSSKVFLVTQEKNNMLLIKPDYVLINFGAYDEQPYPSSYTSPQEYVDNLKTIAALVRGFNGVPIFVTVHAAQAWDANGALLPLWRERNDLMKQVAAELDAPVVDLHKASAELLNQLGGRSGSQFMHWEPGGPADVAHLSPLGAQYVARLAANLLPDVFGPYLTGIFDLPPKP